MQPAGSPPSPATRSRPQRGSGSGGFTLIELLVAMSIATVVSLAAFSIITFATQQVLHNAERGDAQQRVRIALENLMLELHSGCVSAPVTPLRVAPASKLIGRNMIRFVSNSVTTSTIEKPALHVVEYNTEVAGNPRLIEKEYVDANGTTGTSPVPPNWTFAESTPTRTRILLTHVLEAKNASGTAIPIFQYYRYHEERDITGAYGELQAAPMTEAELKVEAAEEEEAVTEEQGRGNNVAKVTITFQAESAQPAKGILAHKDITTPVSDSAIFRVDPSSTAQGVPNLPCS